MNHLLAYSCQLLLYPSSNRQKSLPTSIPKNWVVEKTATDRDGKLKIKNYLSHCSGSTGGVKTPGNRHKSYNKSMKFQATPGCVFF